MKRVEEVINFAKTNKKRIEDLDSKCKSSIHETKTQLSSSFKEDIEKLRDAVMKKFKDTPVGGGSDEAATRSIREDIKALNEKSKVYNDRLNKLEKIAADHEDSITRLMKS